MVVVVVVCVCVFWRGRSVWSVIGFNERPLLPNVISSYTVCRYTADAVWMMCTVSVLPQCGCLFVSIEIWKEREETQGG